MNTRKPILCLDFDGVIHSYTSGWKGVDVIPDPPVRGAIAFMLQALNHFDVQIYSTRSAVTLGRAEMRSWLKRHADATWYPTPDGPGLEDIKFPDTKPPALVTIDDRAITFTGEWPAMETLLNFKPWNKRTRPTIEELEKILNEPTTKVQVNPDGSVFVRREPST